MENKIQSRKEHFTFISWKVRTPEGVDVSGELEYERSGSVVYIV